MFFLIFPLPLVASPITLNIACASNFVKTLKKITALYVMNHDVNVVIIQGASGTLSKQLFQGLPADIFFSADKKNVQYLIEQQIAASSFAYAIGEVVLLVKSQKKYKSAKDFLMQTPHILLSLAKPQLSPYGARSELILRHMGLGEKFTHQLIYGENIGLVFHYVINGHVTAGFVARSQLIEYTETQGVLLQGVHYYTLDDPSNRITQYGVILKSSKEVKTANDFVNYLLYSKEAQQIIHKMGYERSLLVTS